MNKTQIINFWHLFCSNISTLTRRNKVKHTALNFPLRFKAFLCLVAKYCFIYSFFKLKKLPFVALQKAVFLRKIRFYFSAEIGRAHV